MMGDLAEESVRCGFHALARGSSASYSFICRRQPLMRQHPVGDPKDDSDDERPDDIGGVSLLAPLHASIPVLWKRATSRNPGCSTGLRKADSGKITRCPVHIEMVRIKYLNNLVEQEHRFIKRQVKPMLDFKSFTSAASTIAAFRS
jgi:hypothetical protein